jgi:hypothetical protein
MAADEIDRVEVDRLVTELASRKPPKAIQVSSAFAALAAEAAAPPAPTPPAPAPPAGRSWTTAHVLMPATRTEGRTPSAAAARFDALRDRFATLRDKGLDKLRHAEWGAVSVRVFVGLGALLSAAMPYWPYSHAWSWGLLFYFCATELVVVTGIWGAKLTWDAELPAAHTVAVGTVIWGLGLIVWEAAPRLAYA